MKSIGTYIGIFLALIISSCGNSSKTDSVEQANEMNEAKDTTAMAPAGDDSKFMVDAANTGMMEVELGKMAETKASNPEVKKFAAMMVTDHTKAGEELKALAAVKNVTLPMTVSEDVQKHINEMGEKSGADFDNAYIDMMVSGHKDVVSNFENEAEHGTDGDVKSWASTTLMTLRSHLESAQSIDKMMDEKK